MKTFDLIVIGGGPAGIVAASTATTLKKTVALIDCHHELGGAGINTGTVPSKTLRETALALSGIRSRNLLGVDLQMKREVTVADFLTHEQYVKTAFNTMISHQLQEHRAEVYYGTGTFLDPHTVQVNSPSLDSTLGSDGPSTGGMVLQGEKILIATGSSPVRPKLFPFGTGEIYDSDTILQLDRIPKTLAVIGAGVIGSEYACTFSALGTQVHIVDNHDSLLHFLDREISETLATAMSHNGIQFHWKETVTNCSVAETGQITLDLTSKSSLCVDAVLVAAGRQSNTKKLGLNLAGVMANDRGLIPVDKDYQTNVDHIYATGDVIGFPALASTSREQSRKAIHHAFGLKTSGLSNLLPYGIYTIPEVGMVGETEESLQQKKVDYVVGKASYLNSPRGRIIGDQDGFLKLIFQRADMKLIGVHMIGEMATELVHLGLLAMLSGRSVDIFTDACFNTPTLSDLYKSASHDAVQRQWGSAA